MDLVPDPKFDFHQMSASHPLVMVVLLIVFLCIYPWYCAVEKGKLGHLRQSPKKSFDYFSMGSGTKSIVMEMGKVLFSFKTHQVKTKCHVWLCSRYCLWRNEEFYIWKYSSQHSNVINWKLSSWIIGEWLEEWKKLNMLGLYFESFQTK